MDTDSIEMILWRDLAIFLHIGALLGMVLGLLLIFRPHLLERINNVANRWISMRHIFRLLDRNISIEPWFYRHHRPFGILIILGAGYILYSSSLFDKTAALLHLARFAPTELLDGLLDALVLTTRICAAIALSVGLLLWLRPNLLHSIEAKANQWVSSRRATKKLDVQHHQVDRFIAQHARLAGLLLLLGSAYLSSAMYRLLG